MLKSLSTYVLIVDTPFFIASVVGSTRSISCKGYEFELRCLILYRYQPYCYISMFSSSIRKEKIIQKEPLEKIF